MHIRKYPFSVSKIKIKPCTQFVSCSLHSMPQERLFHIPDHYFWKSSFKLHWVSSLYKWGAVRKPSLGYGLCPPRSHSSVVGTQAAQHARLRAWNGHFPSHHSPSAGPLESRPLNLQGPLPFPASQCKCFIKCIQCVCVFSNIRTAYFNFANVERIYKDPGVK